MKPEIGGIGVITAILVLSQLKKALQGLQLIPIYNEGIQVAAQGGDINPYIIATVGVGIAILLPLSLINALTD
jgi:hypothetical protein